MTPTPRQVRRVTVRLAHRSHRELDAAAKREGVSLAQYVREAALMRLAWELGEEAGERGGGEPLRAQVRGHLAALSGLLGHRALDP